MTLTKVKLKSQYITHLTDVCLSLFFTHLLSEDPSTKSACDFLNSHSIVEGINSRQDQQSLHGVHNIGAGTNTKQMSR